MEKVWDNSLSTLVNSNPQAFLDLVLPGARCLHQHRTKLKGTQRQPDSAIETQGLINRFMVNIEFQSSKDAEMAQRLLLYHVLLYWQYKLPVRSYVIYLLEHTNIIQPPLCWNVPDELDKEMLRFCYQNIEMWKRHPEELLRLKHAELLPLLPLTQGGATRETVVGMFDRLAGEQYREFALIGFTFSAIRFRKLKQLSDLEWLERRFRHMYDILRDSPVYEWILAQGREEGKAQGREEGKAQGIAQTRQAVVAFVQEHFPTLAHLAEEVVATIDNLPQLVRLTGKLGSAQSIEQARQSLQEARQ